MAGLAGLYTLQKNLLYLAISNLDAAVFQVTYQTKILTTAIFSVLLLRRKLSRHKVVALFVLTLGVSLVQLDKVEENSSKSYQEQSRWVGVLAVLGACCTSGFGGVYFELVLKPRPSSEPPPGGRVGGRIHPPPPREPPSVWAKNVQLSAFALLIALVASFVKDHDAILAGGFFQGYSPLVVLVVMLEAGGGLVVAVVIKYADNILKSFATAVSIVTSTIVSALVFGFTISKLFVCGCLFVFAAIVLYSRDDDVDVDVGKAGGGGGGAAMPSSARRDRYLPVMQTGTSRDSADCSEDGEYDVDEDDGMAEIAMTEVSTPRGRV
jgi:UDP-sugar transporter A1/2/3